MYVCMYVCMYTCMYMYNLHMVFYMYSIFYFFLSMECLSYLFTLVR